MKVLDSVRVLEIGGIGPGPFCAMHLADLGADVVSIVRPEAEPAATSAASALSRGKRSVFADLKSPEGRDLVLALMRDADALIEGMRPGAMERLGLGPEACQALNPRLVYGRMTGWGQDGPLAQAAGHDNNYAAVSGALWGCAPADARPVSPFATLGDIGGGAMYLMTGLLAGIVQARATGRGTVVDAAIVDGAAHMLNLMLHARQRGLVADERGHSIHDSAPFYETYACADGGFITVGAIEPQFHALLLDRLGLAGAAAFQGPQWDRAAWPRGARSCRCCSPPGPARTGSNCWRAAMPASAPCSALWKPPATRTCRRVASICSPKAAPCRPAPRHALTARPMRRVLQMLQAQTPPACGRR